MIKLGVNIDHVATIRNARGEAHPNLLHAAKVAMSSGANSITIHLREDRRHVKDIDLKKICKIKNIPLNLEIATNLKMLNIAVKNKPNFVCLVPEKRREITTEGGLNLKKNFTKIKKVIKRLNSKKIRTSLFINPNLNDIKLSKKIGTNCIEIHTGKLSNLIKQKKRFKNELQKINNCCLLAKKLNIEVHAGHGLDYKSCKVLSKNKIIKEFNIGHFIIGESIFYGLPYVIKKFKRILK